MRFIFHNQFIISIIIYNFLQKMEQFIHRNTARRTLLLNRTLPFEIEVPQNLTASKLSQNNKIDSQSIVFNFTRCIKLFMRGKMLKQKQVYLSEEERIYSKVQDAGFFLQSQGLQGNWFDINWQKFTKKYPAYEPQLPILIVWYLIVLLLLWFNLFEIPLIIFFGEVVFKSQFGAQWSILINSITIGMLILDMLIKINIAYYKHGIIVLNRLKILKNYFSKQFWIDLVGLIVLVIYVAGNRYELIYIKLLFYIKCYSIWKYDSQVQKVIELNVNILSIYRLIRVIIIFLIYSHWMACGYFAIDYYIYISNYKFYQSNNQTWLGFSACVNNYDMVQLFPDQWYTWYLYSMYWSLQTGTTVGYGDITPKNPQETAYVIVNMIAMAVMFGYFINSVWQILADYNSKRDRYKKNISLLNRFLRNKKISIILKQKMRAYLDYLWKKDSVQQVQKQIISKLTPALRDQLTVTLKSTFFIKLRLFNILNILPKNIVNQSYNIIKKQLAYALVEQYYSQGQIIFTEGDTSKRLFHLLEGKIKIYLKKFSYKGYISTTEAFGQYEFITEQRCKASAQVVKYSHVYYLQKDSFSEVLKNYPVYYQNYLFLESKIKIQRDLEIVNISCFNCYQPHLFIECPQTKLEYNVPTQEMLYPNSLQYRNQRKQYDRKNTKRQVLHIRDKKLRIGLQYMDGYHNFEIYDTDYNLKEVIRKIKKFEIYYKRD